MMKLGYALTSRFHLTIGFWLKTAAVVITIATLALGFAVCHLLGRVMALVLTAGFTLTGYHFFSRWPGLATPPLPDLTAHVRDRASCVRFVALSDTHSRQSMSKPVPDGDVLVHSGDWTNEGGFKEVNAFNSFLGTLPHKTKIVIGGNHDICCDRQTYARNMRRFNDGRVAHGKAPRVALTDEFVGYDAMTRLLSNATYIVDEAVTVDGGLVVYGAPWLPPIPGSHAMAGFDVSDSTDSSGERAEKFAKIPPNVDVLLTHSPPRGVLDLIFTGARVGCVALAARLAELAKKSQEPRFHCFGHVHEARGVKFGAKLHDDKQFVETTFINAASVNLCSRIRLAHGAVVFDVPRKRPHIQ